MATLAEGKAFEPAVDAEPISSVVSSEESADVASRSFSLEEVRSKTPFPAKEMPGLRADGICFKPLFAQADELAEKEGVPMPLLLRTVEKLEEHLWMCEASLLEEQRQRQFDRQKMEASRMECERLTKECNKVARLHSEAEALVDEYLEAAEVSRGESLRLSRLLLRYRSELMRLTSFVDSALPKVQKKIAQLVSEGSLVAQLLASRWDRADLKKEFESHGLADSTLAKLALSSAKAPFRSSEPDESSRERKDAGLPAPAETPPSAVQTPRRQRSASARSSREGGFEEGKGARLESAAASGGASAAETEGLSTTRGAASSLGLRRLSLGAPPLGRPCPNSTPGEVDAAWALKSRASAKKVVPSLPPLGKALLASATDGPVLARASVRASFVSRGSSLSSAPKPLPLPPSALKGSSAKTSLVRSSETRGSAGGGFTARSSRHRGDAASCRSARERKCVFPQGAAGTVEAPLLAKASERSKGRHSTKNAEILCSPADGQEPRGLQTSRVSLRKAAARVGEGGGGAGGQDSSLRGPRSFGLGGKNSSAQRSGTLSRRSLEGALPPKAKSVSQNSPDSLGSAALPGSAWKALRLSLEAFATNVHAAGVGVEAALPPLRPETSKSKTVQKKLPPLPPADLRSPLQREIFFQSKEEGVLTPRTRDSKEVPESRPLPSAVLPKALSPIETPQASEKLFVESEVAQQNPSHPQSSEGVEGRESERTSSSKVEKNSPSVECGILSLSAGGEEKVDPFSPKGGAQPPWGPALHSDNKEQPFGVAVSSPVRDSPSGEASLEKPKVSSAVRSASWSAAASDRSSFPAYSAKSGDSAPRQHAGANPIHSQTESTKNASEVFQQLRHRQHLQKMQHQQQTRHHHQPHQQQPHQQLQYHMQQQRQLHQQQVQQQQQWQQQQVQQQWQQQQVQHQRQQQQQVQQQPHQQQAHCSPLQVQWRQQLNIPQSQTSPQSTGAAQPPHTRAQLPRNCSVSNPQHWQNYQTKDTFQQAKLNLQPSQQNQSRAYHSFSYPQCVHPSVGATLGASTRNTIDMAFPFSAAGHLQQPVSTGAAFQQQVYQQNCQPRYPMGTSAGQRVNVNGAVYVQPTRQTVFSFMGATSGR